MPNRDRNGPEGLGPITGKGLGNCITKDDVAASASNYTAYGVERRGCGRGMGRGCKHGNGRRYYPPVDREASLNAEKEMLKRRLAEIENIMEKSE